MKKNGFSITILPKDMELSGNIKTKGDLRIEGVIRGVVICERKSFIDQQATLIGPIISNDLEICGKVDGDIFVKNNLKVGKYAKIRGNIKTLHLSIEQGAEIDGFIQTGNILKNLSDEILINNFVPTVLTIDSNDIVKTTPNSISRTSSQIVIEAEKNKEEHDPKLFGEGWI